MKKTSWTTFARLSLVTVLICGCDLRPPNKTPFIDPKADSTQHVLIDGQQRVFLNGEHITPDSLVSTLRTLDINADSKILFTAHPETPKDISLPIMTALADLGYIIEVRHWDKHINAKESKSKQPVVGGYRETQPHP